MATVTSFVDDVTGKPLSREMAARISLTIGEQVYTVDVHKDSAIAKQIRSKGKTTAKRGRKAGSRNNPKPNARRRNRRRNSGVGSTTSGAVAGNITR